MLLRASFRELMRAIRGLPDLRRTEAQVKARFEFRSSAAVPVEEALARVRQSLGYVRLLTPPRAGKTSGNAGRYVVRDGELVRVQDTAAAIKRGPSVSKDMRVTDADIKRHYDLVKRQFFMGRERRGN